KQRVLKFNMVAGIIFDEADRLFDMGFKDDISFILGKLPRERQILMFSATNNFDVLHTAYNFGAKPIEINLSKDNIVVDQINQSLIHVGDGEKMSVLVGLLKKYPDTYGMIFCNTKSETHVVAKWLEMLSLKRPDLGLNFRVKAISGNLDQAKRTKLMADFRAKKINLLICTDVAARGLDIVDVTLVINYDLPQDASNYVHRIGRTGRAGKDGRAISLCGYNDTEFLGPIEEFIKAKIPVQHVEESDIVRAIGSRPRLREREFEQDHDDFRRNRHGREKNSRAETREDGRDRNRKPPFSSRPQPVTPQPKTINAKGPAFTNPKEIAVKPSKSSSNLAQENSCCSGGMCAGPVNESKKVDFKPNQEIKCNEVIITSVNFDLALKEAMQKMGIERKELVSHEILEEGKRAFFGLFGKRKNKYKFCYSPNYEMMAQTFLDKVLELASLELSHSITYKKDNLSVDFVGTDEELLTHNRFDLLEALEFLMRKFFIKQAHIHKDFRIDFTCNGQSNYRSQGQNEQREFRGNGNAPRREGPSDKRLEELALRMKQKVLDKKRPVVLNAMGPRDRRIIHQTLGNDKQVKTTSLGNGHYKKIEISPL
ncbi:MAG: helicase-related protein, partial [Bdellovibrionota bacterium]